MVELVQSIFCISLSPFLLLGVWCHGGRRVFWAHHGPTRVAPYWRTRASVPWREPRCVQSRNTWRLVAHISETQLLTQFFNNARQLRLDRSDEAVLVKKNRWPCCFGICASPPPIGSGLLADKRKGNAAWWFQSWTEVKHFVKRKWKHPEVCKRRWNVLF